MQKSSGVCGSCCHSSCIKGTGLGCDLFMEH
uniref:Uncharacterized protein n=1 Tax=Anguilla anguilla TaxID=7936 RepID=A0A0E9QZJ1_ANGAN